MTETNAPPRTPLPSKLTASKLLALEIATDLYQRGIILRCRIKTCTEVIEAKLAADEAVAKYDTIIKRAAELLAKVNGGAA